MGQLSGPIDTDNTAVVALRAREEALGYATPDGRYDVAGADMDTAALDALNAEWRGLWAEAQDGAIHQHKA